MTDAQRIMFANWQIKHNGQTYQANAAMRLTDLEVADLLPTGAIRHPIEGDVVPEGSEQLTDEQKLQHVVAAIGELNLDDGSDDMTQSNGPKTDAIERIVTFDVSADLRNEAWTQYQAQNQGE